MGAALGPTLGRTCQERECWPFFRGGLSPQAWRAERRHPKSRAGSSSTARTSASSASKVMPISRNGSVKSQTIGKRISASRAKGQQSTNRMHQLTKRIRAFTSISFHHVASRQRHAVIMSLWLGKLAIPLRKLPLQVGRWLERLGRIVRGGWLTGRRVFRRRKKRVISAAVIQQRRAAQKQGHYNCSERSDMISNPEFV
jgi:hypothetical protein